MLLFIAYDILRFYRIVAQLSTRLLSLCELRRTASLPNTLLIPPLYKFCNFARAWAGTQAEYEADGGHFSYVEYG
jgi:hypothetical protein